MSAFISAFISLDIRLLRLDIRVLRLDLRLDIRLDIRVLFFDGGNLLTKCGNLQTDVEIKEHTTQKRGCSWSRDPFNYAPLRG